MSCWVEKERCEVTETCLYIALDEEGVVHEVTGVGVGMPEFTHILTDDFGEPIITPHPMFRFSSEPTP